MMGGVSCPFQSVLNSASEIGKWFTSENHTKELKMGWIFIGDREGHAPEFIHTSATTL